MPIELMFQSPSGDSLIWKSKEEIALKTRDAGFSPLPGIL